MRIVIDLQGAQGDSAFRGLGLASLQFAIAFIENNSEHDIHIALNGLFQEAVSRIRDQLHGLLPQSNIHVWYPLQYTAYSSLNHEKLYLSEEIYKLFINSLKPDALILTSFFDGFNDSCVYSVDDNRGYKIFAILYDLIPYIFQEAYLNHNETYKNYYLRKINQFKKIDYFFSISEASSKDCSKLLEINKNRIFTIHIDAHPRFKPLSLDCEIESSLKLKYNIKKPFIMHSGGIDYRKNLNLLIRAYSLIDKKIRKNHQLVLAFSLPEQLINELKIAIQDDEILDDEVVFISDYIPNDDLVYLYNMCQAYVFPSIYEGFGLPILEAMRCGKAVIGSDTSSIPEIIGRQDALFDPNDVISISQKICEVLTNDNFKTELEKWSSVQALKFSWKKTAKTSIDALNNVLSKKEEKTNSQKLKLAYVSPLPPEQTGIADYSDELLPFLSKYYDIDLVVDQKAVSDSLTEKYSILKVDEFTNNFYKYDRVLYHFGNSPFHIYQFYMLNHLPGVIVLHDFFLSGFAYHTALITEHKDFHAKLLYDSHGYSALKRYYTHDLKDVVIEYPCSSFIFDQSVGIIAHSKYSNELAKKFYNIHDKITVIPLLRAAKEHKKLNSEKLLICSFGIVDPIKLNHCIINAISKSDILKSNCTLVFIGSHGAGLYYDKLCNIAKKTNTNVRFFNHVDRIQYEDFLKNADIAVQLRTSSRGETSRAILDCLSCGIPTIVNNHGTNKEIPDDVVYKIPDDFSIEELTIALELLYQKSDVRKKTSTRSVDFIKTNHSPEKIAQKYHHAIENFYKYDNSQTYRTIANYLNNQESSNELLISVSESIAKISNLNGKRTILYDISEVAYLDRETGVQRVVKSILLNLLKQHDYKIEPIYYNREKGEYYYARRFMSQFLSLPDLLNDEPVDFVENDIFLEIDLHGNMINHKEKLFTLKNHGLLFILFVHDILPIRLPHFFNDDVRACLSDWIRFSLDISDAIVCNSSATSNDLRNFIQENKIVVSKNLKIRHINFGNDIENSSPTFGISDDAGVMFKSLNSKINFLMVGTIEPRKGHKQTLKAFEILWGAGFDANLIIVGKIGWKMDDFVETINSHPQLNKKLFWLCGISDEYLEKIYSHSTCLIAASEGEGYGLPIVESAKHNLPIIARDIPVFREVSQNQALFFDGLDPADLSTKLKEWISLYKKNKHPRSHSLKTITWAQSANELLDIIKEVVIESY